MTNEQSVVEAEQAADKLKQAYMAYILPLARAYSTTGQEFTIDELLECQRLGNCYFNHYENFVAGSDLLGAHETGNWITNFAENCHAVLESYVRHMETLRHHAAYLPGINVEPGRTAMAGMQRTVKAYCTKEEFKTLFKAFRDANLPTKGFTVAAHANKETLPTWQIVLCSIIGLSILIGMTGIAIFFPTPTEFQGFIFRGIFALGLSSLIVSVPGFMSMKVRLSSLGQLFTLVAGGSVVIFFVVWLINPPQGFSASEPPSSHQTTEQPKSL